MAKLTAQEFVVKANDKHSYKYDYSLTIYKLYKKHVVITCPIHGQFKQRPDHHLAGQHVHPVKKIKYGVLYQKTLDKESKLKSSGYNVISIWESEFAL